MRENRFELKSIVLSAVTIAVYDSAPLATDHDAFDCATVAKHARLIVDTRAAFHEPAANVIRS